MARKTMKYAGGFFSIMLLLVALPMLANADTNQMDIYEMTLLGTPTYWNLGGVYTSPYNFTLTDPEDGTSMGYLALACDDYTTEVYFGESWYADLNTLSDVKNDSPQPQKFQGTETTDGPMISVYFPDERITEPYSPYVAYRAAGFLVQDILDTYYPHQDAHDTNINSYAVWQIFDSSAYKGWNGTGLMTDNNSAIDPSTGKSYASEIDAQMAWAFSQATSGATLNHSLDIFTPCSLTDPTCANPNTGVAQEFLGMGLSADGSGVPEASVAAFLAFDVFMIGAGFLMMRKRIFRNVGKQR